MRLLNQRRQPRIKHMCVDLRGADVRVAEQLLEAAQIGAVRQQVARERMPQHVGETRFASMPALAASSFSI